MQSFKIIDIFNVSFGKAYLVGQIEDADALIKKSVWTLWVNGLPKQTLLIEGEAMSAKPGHRVLVCAQPIDKSALDFTADTLALVPEQRQ